MNTETKFVERYVSLCSLLCKNESDYTKQKVKIHNKAMAELRSLVDEISADMYLADNIYGKLLHCEESFVQQSAATDCLSLKIHTKQAVKILKRISKYGNRMDAMAAKRTLLIWGGKLDPNDPF